MAQASKEALCWQCRRATGGCEWSAFLQPVPGWQAERTFRRVRRGGAAGAGHTGGGMPEI